MAAFLTSALKAQIKSDLVSKKLTEEEAKARYQIDDKSIKDILDGSRPNTYKPAFPVETL